VSLVTDLRQLRAKVDELVATHDSGRDLDDFAKYKGRPLDFMREELNFVPYAKQVEVIEAFLHHKKTAVRGFHGAGKDAVLAPLMLYAAYVERMLVLAISATEKQLLGQLWKELTNRWSNRLPGQLFTADLRIAGEKRIIATTSGSTSNLTGWHDPHGVFIAISEAQGEQVEAAAFDAAIANAVDDASRIIVAGNPIASAGRFYEVSTGGNWHAIRISASDHPNVIEGRVVIPGGPSPTWPAEMAAEFGTDSPFYVARVLGDFPPSGSVDSLIRRDWLEAAYARHDAGISFQSYPLPALALDVGRSLDRDESVAGVGQGLTVHALHAWRSRDLTVTADRFLAIADEARLAWHAATTRKQVGEVKHPAMLEEWLRGRGVPAFPLIIDTPGVGGGVVDDARKRGRHVTEFWGGIPARNEKRFANQRAEVYWSLRTCLENDTASLPRDPLLHEELLALEWTQDSKSRILMLSKDELKKTIKRSPDRSDTVTMLLSHSTLRAPTVSFSSVAA
jgi:hypothetical protein